MPVRVAVDAMGGDFAPAAVVRGALAALADEPDLALVLVGDTDRIKAEMAEFGGTAARVTIQHASQMVAMDAAPIEALRHAPDSSLVRMVELWVAGQVDAVLSAGNTGAMAAIAQLRMKPLPVVSRPGIAVPIPTFSGPFVLCDVGSNIQPKPVHLYEYAIMASVYAERVLGVERPRVALLSIGEETGKGTSLIKKADELLRADASLNYVGNTEGRELFENRCDVAICDGFVGNIFLKFMEGVAEGLHRTLMGELERETAEMRTNLQKSIGRIWERLDYSYYGGAPLLGLNGVCIISHGRSNERAICNAVKAARRFVHLKLNEVMTARLRKD